MRSIKAKRGHAYSLVGAVCLLLVNFSPYPTYASGTDAARRMGVRADAISIEGAVEHPGSLTLADLKREAATTETVSLKTGKGVLTGRYTGVLLWTLLQHAVIKTSESKNDVIRHTLVITSSDGYATVLSAGEIDPQFGGERAIIAYAKDGQPLTDKRGFARLIVPGDTEAARAISGVASITVR